MRVLRFLWRGVLAFDRIGSRIPQLIQIWLVEFLFILPLTFFVAKVIDIRGCCGVVGTGEALPGVFWGSLALACVTGFFFFKNLLRPRLVQGTWTPITTAQIGPVSAVAVNRSWQVSYSYLTSHPSYALLLVPTASIPAVMVLMTQHHGDSVFYWRVAGYVGLSIIAVMALLRLVAWHLLRSGRSALEEVSADSGHSPERVAWEVAWKPVLMLIVLMALATVLPLGIMFWNQHRTIQALDVVSPAAASDAGAFYRVEGEVVGEPVFWAPRGTGRGGNNYSGGGVLVALDGGGEALLLAESLSVPDLRGDLADLDGGRISAQGEVITAISDDQVTYYGFDLDDFPPPDAAGRVLVLHGYP